MKKYFTYIIPILIIFGMAAGLYFTMAEYRGSRLPAASIGNPPSSPASPSPGQQPQPQAKPVNQLGPVDNNSGATAIAILMYHVIGNGPNSLFVPADSFEAQMNYLFQKGYHTVTMAEVEKMLVSGCIPAKTVALTFDDGYSSVYTTAWPILQKYGFTGTIYVCSSFPGRPNYLSWEEIKSLQAGGMEIGSHTRNHPDLKTASIAMQREEVIGAKKILEEQLGITVNSFCYPSGAYNEDTLAIVKEAGYTSAVTVAYGCASPQNNIYLLPRIRVPGWITLDKFAKSLPDL
ncbi:MAG: polysaccharide deacetylase family protein [Syntrophomonadaceae bacterium]|nr:polysaccharide deacetylase family protein [Syntrophomonadaceae bacterium]